MSADPRDPFADPAAGRAAEAFPEPGGFGDDDVPVIDDTMIDHGELVDFEQRMSPVPPLSLTLMAACVAAFGLQLAGDGLADVERLIGQGALHRPAVLEDSEWWRLVSAMFLHGNFGHLIGNLLMLFVLGMACEHAFGRPQFLALYVGAGVIGSLCSLIGGRPSVGASGAIFGLAGALIVLFRRHRRRLHLRDARIGLVLLIWAVYTLALGLIDPTIDNLAHLGGLLGGAALAFVLRPAVLEGRSEVARRPTTIVAAGLAGLALLATAPFFLPRLAG